MKTFTKFNVHDHEYAAYQYIYNLDIINMAKPIYYDPNQKILTTEYIDALNIADEYTDDPNCVPDNIFEMIVDVINTLYQHNIIYKDITGYNFIYHDEKIWLVDFEYVDFETNTNDFVKSFIKWTPNHPKQWNPEFL